MDLTTLSLTIALILGVLGIDTIWHPRDVVLEAQVASQISQSTFTEEMLSDIVKEEAMRVADTPSIVARPVIQVGRADGIAISIAESLHVGSVAYALQSQVGIQPDHIKLRMFIEGGTPKILVTGFGNRRFASFQQEVVQEKGETLVGLAHRAAILTMARIDPYITALNLMQRHTDDKDFNDAEAVMTFAMATLPPTPENVERSRFLNLQGIIALFRDDPQAAHELFEKAMASDPDNPVPVLNAAFADMAVDNDSRAVQHMERLLATDPPTDTTLLAGAWTTLAGARLGTHDIAGAEKAIAQSVATYPNSAVAYELWSEIRRAQGDTAGADRLHAQALASTKYFENYAEVAALWFRLAWRDGEPMMRNPYTNPPPLRVKAQRVNR